MQIYCITAPMQGGVDNILARASCMAVEALLAEGCIRNPPPSVPAPPSYKGFFIEENMDRDDNSKRRQRPIPESAIMRITMMIEDALRKKGFDEELDAILQRYNITTPTDHGTRRH